MDRYMGLDAHASTCTLGVMGPSGKRLSSQVVETNARALIEVVRAVAGKRHLCTEEGALAEWLCEVLEPHVQERVVVGVRESRGPENDKLDAFGLAEQLRIGTIPIGAGGLREGGPGAVGGAAAGGNAASGGAAVRGARRADGAAREGGEGAPGRGEEAPGVASAEDVSWAGAGAHGRAAAGGGNAVPVPEPQQVLGLLRAGRGDAHVIGLGEGRKRAVGEGTGASGRGG
jgi:hypothetical protein